MDTEEYLSQEELAKRWKLSPKTIRRMRQTGELPTFHIRRNVFRFRLKDVLIFEQSGRVAPAIGPRSKNKKNKA